MPAPVGYTYASSVIVSANTAVLSAIDAGAGAGKVVFLDDTDAVLGTVTLNDPGGTVDSDTGQLTLSPAGTGAGSADGNCTYAEIRDSNDNVVVALPAQAGDSAVSGYVVINSLSIANGATITLVSATIG